VQVKEKVSRRSGDQLHSNMQEIIGWGLIALAKICFAAPHAPTATIDAGVVIGTTTSVAGASATIVNKFLGIPYAASPIRFAMPTKPAHWSKPYDASNYSWTCPQQFSYPEEARELQMAQANSDLIADEGEDCLNLNIWVPKTPKRGKAVMIWIHGGDMTTGSSALTSTDGTSFAANQNVIIVSINYRVNVYGFPGSPQLPFKKQNLGLYDQRLAFDWVQRNIHAFGGDPKRVTIFGQSAGSASVDLHVLTMSKKPPFSAAICQSGTGVLYSGLQLANYSGSWNAMVAGVKCADAKDVLACVRKVPRRVLTNAIERRALSFYPVIDNVTVLPHQETFRAKGKIAPIPILTGTTANEGRSFLVPYYNATSSVPYLTSVWKLTEEQATLLAGLYPIGSKYISSAYEQMSQIQTDLSFTCPAAFQFNGTHEAGYPVHRYVYTGNFPNTRWWPDINTGAYHSSEIRTIFGTYYRKGATEPQKRLSKYMQKTWADFAKDPKAGPGWRGWPNVMSLGPDANGKGVGHITTAEEFDWKCAFVRLLYESVGVF
jgi:carboxylesterase type B